MLSFCILKKNLKFKYLLTILMRSALKLRKYFVVCKIELLRWFSLEGFSRKECRNKDEIEMRVPHLWNFVMVLVPPFFNEYSILYYLSFCYVIFILNYPRGIGSIFKIIENLLQIRISFIFLKKNNLGNSFFQRI